MKKVVYILTLAVAVAITACNSGSESSQASSKGAGGSNVGHEKVDYVSSNPESPAAQPSGVDVNVTKDVNTGGAKTAPAAPFSPEDAAKYKEGIKLVKDYSDEINKCVDAKMSGNAIDEAQKQRITEIQNQLRELEKAGKMNQQLLELKKISDDVYTKVLEK